MKLLKKLFVPHNSSKMEKEIYEQENVIRTVIGKYIKKDEKIDISLPEDINKVALIASGSSYHSAAIAANFMRKSTHLYAQAYYASEIALLDKIDVDAETLYIFISQSGETYDTNQALSKIAPFTDKTFAVTNTKDSSLYNKTKYKMLTFAGVEKAIASTKAMSAQTFCLFLICVKLMQERQYPVSSVISELTGVPVTISKMFEKRKQIAKYAKILAKYDNATVLATGMFYPLAKEAALKIKETSYINTTAYPTGEFLHGHVALLNKKCAVISFLNNGNVDFMLNVLKKIDKNYETDSLIISAFPLYNIYDKSIINVATGSEINFLFGTLILLQLLAYETSVLLSRDVDKPKGLTKILK